MEKSVQMKKNSDFIETLADSKNSRTFATAIEKQTMQRKLKIGSLDEWLSQRSAKPCTAVRIRQEPQGLEVWVSG